MTPANARRSLGGLALAAVLAGACNAISGLDGDFALAGGGTLPGEGGADSSSGSSGSSGNTDADPHDANNDGSADGGGALDCNDPPPGPAAGAMAFCDNFDDPSKTGNLWGWDRRQATSGSPTVEQDIGFVARGLRADITTTGTPPGDGWVTVLWKTLGGGLPDTQKITTRFRFKIAAEDIDYTVIGAIQLNGLEYGVALYKNPNCPGGTGKCIDDNDHAGGHGNFNGAVPLTLGQWYQADITVTRSGTAFGGKVVLAGVTAPLDDRASGALPQGSASNVEVGVGSFFSSNNGNANVVVDDVIVWRH